MWFSPNVKAEIDSATTTQLFLKVPGGAVTGEVAVSNGVYADTIRSGFKVIADEDTPKDIEFTPNIGYVGTRVFITGKNIILPATATISGIKVPVTTFSGSPYFVVPQGARTGKFAITNNKGKAGTPTQELKIITDDQNCTAQIGGIKVIKNASEFYYHPSTGNQSSTSIDTTIISAKFNITRCGELFNSMEFYAIGSCFSGTNELPFPENNLQCFQYFEPLQYLYNAILLENDSTNMIMKKIHIVQINYKRHKGASDNTGNYTDCSRLDIELTNVPYTNENGKKIISLTNEKLKEYLTKYTFKTNYSYNKGNSSNGKSSEIKGIYEILPDAYFELTLE